MKPHYVQAQGPPLSPKISFVSIDPADWTVSGYNHPVSTSVFSVSMVHGWIILKKLLRFYITKIFEESGGATPKLALVAI